MADRKCLEGSSSSASGPSSVSASRSSSSVLPSFSTVSSSSSSFSSAFASTSSSSSLLPPSSTPVSANSASVSPHVLSPPDTRIRSIVSWSSGKDSALALSEALADTSLHVIGLLTTVNTEFHRVSMHGVREELLQEQAQRLNLPLYKACLPFPCSNDEYERIMGTTLQKLVEETRVQAIVFGDLFLRDVRAYREGQLSKLPVSPPIVPRFPLWGRDTAEVARHIQATGIKAVITCLDPKALTMDFAGKKYDEQFVTSLPPTVDPCGENGEFHTFVTHSPLFSSPIEVHVGETIERGGFVYTDILPA